MVKTVARSPLDVLDQSIMNYLTSESDLSITEYSDEIGITRDTFYNRKQFIEDCIDFVIPKKFVEWKLDNYQKQVNYLINFLEQYSLSGMIGRTTTQKGLFFSQQQQIIEKVLELLSKSGVEIVEKEMPIIKLDYVKMEPIVLEPLELKMGGVDNAKTSI